MRKLLLMLGGLLVGLLLAELVCRLVLEDPLDTLGKTRSSWRVEGLVADPELAYSFQPGYAGRMLLDGEFDLPFRINGQGLRDEVDFAPEHPGVTRILLLGDSFAFGVGVPFEDTLGEQLERAFEAGPEGAPRCEVVAAGVPGYAPDDYALLAERWVPRVHPDLVLVAFFTGNDILDTVVKREDPMQVVEGFLVNRRQAWSYRIRKYSVLANMALARFNPYGRTEHDRPLNPTPAEVEKVCRSLRPWLVRLADVSKDGGPPVTTVLLYGKDYAASLQKKGSAYPIKGLSQVVKDLRQLGVTVLDPQEAWKAQGVPVESYYFPRDAHHTAAGNRFLAEWIASGLREGFPFRPDTAANSGR